MIRTVKFYGAMRKKYGASFSFSASNWAQLLGGLVSAFGSQIKEEIRQGAWHLIDGRKSSGNDFEASDVPIRSFKSKVLHLVPAVQGASGVFRTILGVILIAIGAYTGNYYLVAAGTSLTVGGVMSMLTKPVNTNASESDSSGSYLFNGAMNVTTQGGPIPMVYGRVRRCASVVIASDFSSVEVS